MPNISNHMIRVLVVVLLVLAILNLSGFGVGYIISWVAIIVAAYIIINWLYFNKKLGQL